LQSRSRSQATRWTNGETFVGQLNGAKKADYVANRKKLKVRERTFHQQTPQGDFVVVTMNGDDPEGAFTRFAEGTDPFTQWFKTQAMEIHGVDLSKPPPGPLPKLGAGVGLRGRGHAI
jgi:hypothetical protein